MKIMPAIISTTKALRQALESGATVICADRSLYRTHKCEFDELIGRYEYDTVSIPGKKSVFFRHPDAEDVEIYDPKGIL